MSEHRDCHWLIKSLSDYVDGELEAHLCEELEKHLKDCDNCRIVVNTLKKTIELYQTDSAAETLPDDVRSRLYHRLDLSEYLDERSEA